MFVVLAWGINFSIVKVAYLDFSPTALGLIRFLLMWLILLVVCKASGQSLKYESGQFWRYLLAGFIGSGIYMIFFLEGMHSAPAALGAIALATAPIFTTLFSVALGHDSFRWSLVIGILLSFFGVTIGVLGRLSDSKGSAFGALLVLVSAVLWATSVILYRGLLTKDSPIRVLTLSFPGALLPLTIYGGRAALSVNWAKVSFSGWLSLSYLVIVAGVGAFLAYYKGLADVGPAQASLTQYLVPPLAAISGAIFLQERITIFEISSLTVVLIGLFFAVQKRLPVTS